MAELELHRPSETLFTASSDGVVVGRASVAIGEGAWEFYSTSVDPAHEGHGIASRLVRFALDAAAEAGVRVIPTCWYVDGWIDRHPQYAPLREASAGSPTGSAEDPQCRVAPRVLPGA